jgi:hypothetical protein
MSSIFGKNFKIIFELYLRWIISASFSRQFVLQAYANIMVKMGFEPALIAAAVFLSAEKIMGLPGDGVYSTRYQTGGGL